MARSRPVISVAIATRNYGRYLPRALESVFRCHNPTDAPIQVVVADDASTDETRAVLAAYRQRHPQELEIVSLRTPAGVGAAKNAALDRCLGRSVALLDADDEFLPEKLIHAHAALQQIGVDFVTNDFYLQTQGGERVLRDRHNGSDWYWPPSTWMFRRGLVRFNEYRLGGDDPEWLERRWSSVRHRHRHLDLPLNVQHLHGANAQRQARTLVPGLQAVGRILGKPHPDDLLAPRGWACRECGNQYLLPASCCGRQTIAAPLYFYMAALSPHVRSQVEFSLVMLTHNGLPLTRRAVSSLLATLSSHRAPAVELIVVDHYSTDGTLDYIRHLACDFPIKLILTHPAEPFLYARACNRGALVAAARFLFLFNNDIDLLSQDPWEPLRAALSDPKVGVVGSSTAGCPTQDDPGGTSVPPLYRYVDQPIQGAFWGMRREVYWELGGLDEALTGCGCEGLNFQLRAQAAHYHLAMARVNVGSTRQAMLGAKACLHEPLAGRGRVEQSVVITARNEAAGLRETLEQAAGDGRCWSGQVQVVVVDEGSEDETEAVLQAYRRRLGPGLTVVRLEGAVGRARAREAGRARAIGQSIHVLAPGDWIRSSGRDGADRSERRTGVPAGSAAAAGDSLSPTARYLDRLKRSLRRPTYPETLLDAGRLDNIQQCVTEVLHEGVPGDLIETGVWRGGATIFMRALLKAYGDTERAVWVADSFQGLHRPDPTQYPADRGDRSWMQKVLTVSLEEVKANFDRYGLLDGQVRFLPGWFRDTLPTAPIERLAVLRLDGDMYESTIQALSFLYPKLSCGGYVIIDDYGAVPGCRRAVEDYRREQGIDEKMEPVEGGAVYWRRVRGPG